MRKPAVIDLLPENHDAVARHLRVLGWVAPEERIESIAPAGDGNMNRTLRLRLNGRSIVLKQSVPWVAKYPQIAAPADRIFVEAAFYRAAAARRCSRCACRVCSFDRTTACCVSRISAHRRISPTCIADPVRSRRAPT
jgi:5-methylthioribose kinase